MPVYVRKRGDKNYQYIARLVVNGKTTDRTQANFTTESKARKAGELKLSEMLTTLSIDDSDKLFADYYKEWMEAYKIGMSSPATDNMYKRVHRLVEQYFPNTKMKDISHIQVQRFVNDFAKNRTATTVRKNFNKLSMCLLHAFHNRVIPIDVTYNINISGQKSKPKETKFLHQSELKKLTNRLMDGISFADTERYFLLLQIATGRRIGEIMAVTYNTFNLDKKTLIINQNYDYLYTRQLKDTKNGVHTTIELDERWIEFFKPFLLYKKKEMLQSKITNKHNLIFVDKYMQPVHYEDVNSLLEKFCLQCGFKTDNGENKIITSHGIRHSVASNMLANGIDLMIVAEQLGDTPETIQKVYAHVINEMRVNNMDKIKKLSVELFA
ncbi:tyrosine-type recombinase/integrase [Jeotgalibaca sp. A127]|uniref:tyrosine-type recombinase/integrase n=1 Tax=Jeotgalibaca sp. A127 TaxID=3457324 RepID=UPI003FCFABA2